LRLQQIFVTIDSRGKPMMQFLAGLVRGLHMAIGIHTPPPEQESLYVFVWIGLILFMFAGLALLFYVLG
jgi:hypothetical protein